MIRKLVHFMEEVSKLKNVRKGVINSKLKFINLIFCDGNASKVSMVDFQNQPCFFISQYFLAHFIILVTIYYHYYEVCPSYASVTKLNLVKKRF